MNKEDQNIEYKQSWRDEYLKWICGFANAQGGKLIIGVDDDGNAVGVANAQKLMEDIPNKIRDTMGIVADVALLRKNGKNVIRVMVKKSVFPVCYRGEYHYRSGSVKMLLTGTALTEFLLSKSGIDWDAAPTSSGFMKDEHSFTALAARYRKERKSKRIQENLRRLLKEPQQSRRPHAHTRILPGLFPCHTAESHLRVQR